jgi:hypothetical protein
VRRKIAAALVVVAVAVGVWVGFWEAHFWVVSTGGALDIPGVVRPPSRLPIAQPQFARWLCALLGAGAAALIALVALAVDRWPKPSYSN